MDLEEDDIVFELFKKYIEEKGFTIKGVDEDGLISVENGEMDFNISLDNLRKDFARDPSEEIIERFVSAIVEAEDLPAWVDAKTDIFPSLFPADFDFGEYVNYPVTNTFHMNIVYEDEVKKTWISESQLEEWGIDNQLLLQTAYANLDRVLDGAELEVEEYEDGRKLFCFSIADETMKAVLLMAKGLKAKVKDVIGWPICAVIPVRDFCFLFNSEHLDYFAERLGDVVMREYNESGYQLTTEILECSDEGINAIANYEANDEESA